MNIRQAKEELKNTVQAYLKKDEMGFYEIPEVNQRPLLFMGPPGIGKTAIMDQVAAECGIGLVAYTMTHHTRQSAVGLPMIEQRRFDGVSFSVTEYTMSEIIASIYKKIEETGRREGILFIDEINCVSETLAPTMLQFLQKKTFGGHKIPNGWIIAAAGNPPEYNKSVREFDIVTLDRVRILNIEEDFDTWKEYAYGHQIHGSILSYLEIKQENFYHIETNVQGMQFVTARSWEDLSKLIYVYEKLQIPVTCLVIEQYLQNPEIAKDFSFYYELYEKYKKYYQIPEILKGNLGKDAKERLKTAGFDEKLSVTNLLSAALSRDFAKLYFQGYTLDILYEALKKYKKMDLDVQGRLETIKKEEELSLKQRKAAAELTKEEEEARIRMLDQIELFSNQLKQEHILETEAGFARLRELFFQDQEKLEDSAKVILQKLEYAFDFMEQTFGEGQEMVVFVTQLTVNPFSMRFFRDYGCDRYDKYARSLLMYERKKKLSDEIQRFANREELF